MYVFKGIPNNALGNAPLPDYAVLYFDHLISEFDYMIENEPDKKLTYSSLISSLKEKRKSHTATQEDDEKSRKIRFKRAHISKNSLSWNELYSLELVISRILPVERLPREVWSLRSRYRDVVGLAQYEAYLASKPPDIVFNKEKENEYRADIEYLITEIYLRYLTTPYNESLRNKISNKVTILILVGLAIVILCIIRFNTFAADGDLGAVSLALVMFTGAMGGLLSMQQRYQSVSHDGDPLDNIALLNQKWSRLFMPAINGAVFSILLYMIIVGGLIDGQLFPKMCIPESESLIQQIKATAPDKAIDAAKLVVWSFLAGFAERFVPDTLSRFISSRDSAKAAK